MTSTLTPTTQDRAPVLRWSLGVVLLAGVVLVVVLLVGGGAPQPIPAGLPDPGPFTGWALPVVRLLADLAGLVVLGLVLAAGVLLPSSVEVLTRPGFAATQLAAKVAVAWAVTVAFELVLTVSDILGIPLGQAVDPTILRSFATQVPQGRALLVQLVLALVVAALVRSTITPARAMFASALALVTLLPPALTGHSAASGSHELAVASLVVHVAAASLWVGGLASLTWMALAPAGRTDQRGFALALARFSTMAVVCWAAVGISGVVNAGVRLGSLGALVTSAYGALVLAKAVALAVLGGFGWWHRRHTVDQVRENASARPLFVRVAAVELVVMAATFGLAVGLSRTPTPVGEANTDRATELLGFPLPPAPDLWRLVFGYVPDGFAITFVLGAGLLYAAGVHALRRRGDSWPLGRTLAWYAGLLVVAWATIGGLGLYSHVMFSWHMVAHMALSMIAPIGLVLGAPITLALRALPGRRTPKELGLKQALQKVVHSRVVRVVSHPVVAAGFFVASLYGLYFTPLFGVMMASHLGHVLMETHFLLVGCLFFWVLVGVDPTPLRLHPFMRIVLLLLVMPFHAFFAITLMDTDQVMAPDYYGGLSRPYATDLLADQHLGGAVSWALGEVPIVLVVAAIFVQWLRSDQREAKRKDRAHDSGTDDEHDRYNAWLSGLATQQQTTRPTTPQEPTTPRRNSR